MFAALLPNIPREQFEKHCVREIPTAAVKSHRGKKSVHWVWLAHSHRCGFRWAHGQPGGGSWGSRLPIMLIVTSFCSLTPGGFMPGYSESMAGLTENSY